MHICYKIQAGCFPSRHFFKVKSEAKAHENLHALNMFLQMQAVDLGGVNLFKLNCMNSGPCNLDQIIVDVPNA